MRRRILRSTRRHAAVLSAGSWHWVVFQCPGRAGWSAGTAVLRPRPARWRTRTLTLPHLTLILRPRPVPWRARTLTLPHLTLILRPRPVPWRTRTLTLPHLTLILRPRPVPWRTRPVTLPHLTLILRPRPVRWRTRPVTLPHLTLILRPRPVRWRTRPVTLTLILRSRPVLLPARSMARHARTLSACRVVSPEPLFCLDTPVATIHRVLARAGVGHAGQADSVTACSALRGTSGSRAVSGGPASMAG
jgi:hypothetical protein